MASQQFTPRAPRSQSALPFRRVLPASLRRWSPELEDDERGRLLARRDALASEIEEVEVNLVPLEMPSEDREAHQRRRRRFSQAHDWNGTELGRRGAQACHGVQSSIYPQGVPGVAAALLAKRELPSLELPVQDRAAALSARVHEQEQEIKHLAFMAGMRRRCGDLQRDAELSKLKGHLRETLKENARLQTLIGAEPLDTPVCAPTPPSEAAKTEPFRRSSAKHFRFPSFSDASTDVGSFTSSLSTSPCFSPLPEFADPCLLG